MAGTNKENIAAKYAGRLQEAGTPTLVATILKELRNAGFNDAEVRDAVDGRLYPTGFRYIEGRFRRQASAQAQDKKPTQPTNAFAKLIAELQSDVGATRQNSDFLRASWAKRLSEPTMSGNNLGTVLAQKKNAQERAGIVRRSLTCARAMLHFEPWDGKWDKYAPARGPTTRAAAELGVPLAGCPAPTKAESRATSWSMQANNDLYVVRKRQMPFTFESSNIPIESRGNSIGTVHRSLRLFEDEYFALGSDFADMFPTTGKPDTDGYTLLTNSAGSDLQDILHDIKKSDMGMAEALAPLAGVLCVGQEVTLQPRA